MAFSDELNKLREAAEATPPPPAEPTPPAEPPATPEPTPTPEPPPAPDRLAIIGEVFGRTFASDDELEQFKAEITAHPEREASWLKEKEELEAGIDESKFYPNDQFRTLAKLMMSFPGKNPLAITEMVQLDTARAYIDDPVNVLALSLMLDNPEIYPDKASAMEVIAHNHQLEQNEDGKWEMSDSQRRAMQTEAKRAIGGFDELKKSIPAPQNIDVTGKRAEKQQAEQARVTKITEASKTFFTKTIPASLKAIDIPVTIKGEDGKEATEIAFSYTIPEGFAKSKAVQDVIEVFRQDRIRNAADWTPEIEAQTLQEVSETLMSMYLFRNRTEIYKAIADDLNVKFKDEAWMKKHNVRGLRTDGTTKAPTADQIAEKNNLQEAARRIGMNITV